MQIYSFGYEGWGPYPDKLLALLREVSAQRSFGAPLLVDTRVRREVRAPGFTAKGIAGWATRQNYRWIPELGNAYIGGARSQHTVDRGWGNIAILDGRAIAPLADLIQRLDGERRNVIFFCHCPLPRHNCRADGSDCLDCHRSAIAELLSEELVRRGEPFAIQEWPGGKAREVALELAPSLVRKLLAPNYRKSIPFDPTAWPQLRCLPWGSRVVATSSGPEQAGAAFVTGPAKPTAGSDWLLPVLTRPVAGEALEALRAEAERFMWRHGLGALTNP